MNKIEKELEEFKKFKENYQYELKEVEEREDGEYYDGEPLINEKGKEVGECDKWIIHTMGTREKSETVFTRYEFEKELNCLKDFLKKEKNN